MLFQLGWMLEQLKFWQRNKLSSGGAAHKKCPPKISCLANFAGAAAIVSEGTVGDAAVFLGRQWRKQKYRK